jgi:hypothetical protein
MKMTIMLFQKYREECRTHIMSFKAYMYVYTYKVQNNIHLGTILFQGGGGGGKPPKDSRKHSQYILNHLLEWHPRDLVLHSFRIISHPVNIIRRCFCFSFWLPVPIIFKHCLRNERIQDCSFSKVIGCHQHTTHREIKRSG